MNILKSGWLTVGLLAAPIAATAQTTTLEYQSNALTGTTTYYNNPTPAYLLTPPEFAASFSSAPFIGDITASLKVSGGIALSGVVDVMGYNGKAIDFSFGLNALGSGSQPLNAYNGSSGTVDLIRTNGAITGAIVDVTFSSYHAPSMFLTIGPSGDSISYIYEANNGPCTEQRSGGGPNPCTVVASSHSAGVWQATAAPEIDPASAASGLMLLLGSIAVLRGSKNRTTNPAIVKS